MVVEVETQKLVAEVLKAGLVPEGDRVWELMVLHWLRHNLRLFIRIAY